MEDQPTEVFTVLSFLHRRRSREKILGWHCRNRSGEWGAYESPPLLTKGSGESCELWPETHFGVFWRPQNAPFSTCIPMLQVRRTMFHVTFGRDKSEVWEQDPLVQHRTAPVSAMITWLAKRLTEVESQNDVTDVSAEKNIYQNLHKWN